MADWTVTRRGTDSSGRGIYASDYMWERFWLPVCETLGFAPTITQGAWMTMSGGGAQASAGYHDGGGCFDLRVRDRPNDVDRMIRVIREHGAAAWLRNEQHGGFSDPHIHLVLGSDHDLDDGAYYQWRTYLTGGDGMGGRDYHPRPSPLVIKPPEVDPMANYAEQLNTIERKIDALSKDERRRNLARIEQIRRVIKKVTGVDADLARIEKALAEE